MKYINKLFIISMFFLTVNLLYSQKNSWNQSSNSIPYFLNTKYCDGKSIADTIQLSSSCDFSDTLPDYYFETWPMGLSEYFAYDIYNGDKLIMSLQRKLFIRDLIWRGKMLVGHSQKDYFEDNFDINKVYLINPIKRCIEKRIKTKYLRMIGKIGDTIFYYLPKNGYIEGLKKTGKDEIVILKNSKFSYYTKIVMNQLSQHLPHSSVEEKKQLLHNIYIYNGNSYVFKNIFTKDTLDKYYYISENKIVNLEYTAYLKDFNLSYKSNLSSDKIFLYNFIRDTVERFVKQEFYYLKNNNLNKLNFNIIIPFGKKMLEYYNFVISNIVEKGDYRFFMTTPYYEEFPEKVKYQYIPDGDEIKYIINKSKCCIIFAD